MNRVLTRREHMIYAFAGAVLALIWPITSASAQRDETVPRRLALALLAGRWGPGQAPLIHVGRAPDNLPGAALPKDGRVLGSVVVRTTTTTIIELSLPAESVLAMFSTQLAAGGWTAPVTVRERGGFVSTTADRRPLFLCRGDETVQVSANAADESGRLWTVTHTTDSRACQDLPPRRPRFEEGPMPALAGPPGDRLEPSGSGGGSDGWYSAATLHTGRALAAVLDHFARQLREAGWTEADRATSTKAGIQAWTSSRGDEQWTGVLAATIAEPGRMHVNFRMVRLEPS
jgi:hypothetical protein